MSAGTRQPENKEQGVHEGERNADKTIEPGNNNIISDGVLEKNKRDERTGIARPGPHKSPRPLLPEGRAVEGDVGEPLKMAVQKQIEYYFSRENLISDTYLISQMDSDKFVPVAVIAGFNQVRKLTGDLEVIMEAIRVSEFLQLDETSQKVKAHSKRCMLLVTGIPQDTSEEVVRGLFRQREDCPECISCEVAHRDAWYIEFDTEEGAQKAFRYLREVVSEFQGRPLSVRVKEKVFHRQPPSISPSSHSSVQQQPFNPMGFGRGMPFQPSGPFYQHPPSHQMYLPFMPPLEHSFNGVLPMQGNLPPQAMPHSSGGVSGGGKFNEGGRVPPQPPRHNPHTHMDRPGRGGGRGRDERPPSGRGRRKDEDLRLGGGGGPNYRSHRAPPQNLDLAPGNFPPLPNSIGGPPSQVHPSSTDEGGNLLADVVKRMQGPNPAARPSSESVFDGGPLVPHPSPHRPSQRSVSASEQGYRSGQKYQANHGSTGPAKTSSFNRGPPGKYSGRPSGDSREPRQAGAGAGGGYSRSRNRNDKKPNSTRNSPRSSRHTSLPPPPTSDTDKQDLSPNESENKMSYAAMAQRKQKSPVGGPGAGQEEGREWKGPDEPPTKVELPSEGQQQQPTGGTSAPPKDQHRQTQQHDQHKQQQQHKKQQHSKQQQNKQHRVEPKQQHKLEEKSEQQERKQHQQQQQHEPQEQSAIKSPSKDKVEEGLSTAELS